MVEPWADAGHDCTIVDIEPTDCTHPRVTANRADVLTWEPGGSFDVVFGFPPCTDLAVSGARWFAEKERLSPGTRARALALFDRVFVIAKQVGARAAFAENPVSVLSSERRTPDYSFHPFEYGGYLPADRAAEDGYTKKTCLWASVGFVMPPRRPVPVVDGDRPRIHWAPPGPDRARFRSVTPRGFARAVFLSNNRSPLTLF